MPSLARFVGTFFSALMLTFAICATASAETFTVTNVNDSGMGSLRQAMLDANGLPGFDTINFSIGSGVQTITPSSALPAITDPVLIDATTQPGYNNTPLIEIDGRNAGFGAAGIRISAGSSMVRGLVINRFSDQIVLETNGNNVIVGSYFGINPSGTIGYCCSNSGILINNSADNLIGGTTAQARNVLSGNGSSPGTIIGVNITGVGSTGNRVQGNFIGTNPSGTAVLGNSGVGVSINNGASNNLIGGTADGARNVISGNNNGGVNIASSSNQVQGNYIGIDVTGTVALSNNGRGITISGSNNLIGGTTLAARNVISGNGREGVDISQACCTGNESPITGNLIQGNYVGLNAAGNAAIPNNEAGVTISSINSGVVLSDNVIGGTQPGAGNVISGNRGSGLQLRVFNGGINAVQGNYIGSDPTGTFSIPNRSGIALGGQSFLIGGTVPGARNVISGNGVAGVAIVDFGNGTSTFGNVVQGNYIGTNAAGTSPLPNRSQGIGINNASRNTIGGAGAGAGNLIAYNGSNGISIDFANFAVNNQIRGNSIFSNGALGIDLGFNGATPNDAGDGDAGANNLQNFPVVRTVATGGNSTAVQGTLNSAPNASYVIELFANDGCDPSGHGEGQFSLGAMTTTTDASGNATFSATFPVQLAPGQVVTATATDSNGNTSEFSVCNEVDRPGRVQFSSSSYTTSEAGGSVVITVGRTLGTADTASVDYATSDGSATANADYTPASGTLFFASGETTKTFTVQLLNDSLGETMETVNLTLSNVMGSTLGNPSSAVLNITDNDPIPTATINTVLVNEESLGDVARAVFTAQLSAVSNNTVTIQYRTMNNFARANLDYMPVSGQLTFMPGETIKTITVPIIGDTIDESDEDFFVIFDEVVNANITGRDGRGIILDNDPDPGTTGELLITEFRPSGPAGANDEFVEIYNNTNADIDLRNYSLVFVTNGSPTVVSFAALQGVTAITPRSHRLLANSEGYSLSAYASGSVLVSGADFFADNQGIALRRNGSGAQVDAVGFTDDPAEFREGMGLAVITAFPEPRPEYSYVRKLVAGAPQDTNDNAEDFVLVTTRGESISGVPSVLGAPGPQNRNSPVQRNAAIKSSFIDPLCAGFGSSDSACARVRDGSDTNPNNAALGTLTIRRKFTNNTGSSVSQLRFRIVNITTQGNRQSNEADVRALSSSAATVTDSFGNEVTINGLTLEENPPAQPNGGGLNSSLRENTITIGTPLAPGASVNVQFRLGVMVNGGFRFLVNVEALPAPTTTNLNRSEPATQKSRIGKMSNTKGK